MKKIILLVLVLATCLLAMEKDKLCEDSYSSLFQENKKLDTVYNTKDIVLIEQQLYIVLSYAKSTEQLCQIGTIENAFGNYVVAETEDGIMDIEILKRTRH